MFVRNSKARRVGHRLRIWAIHPRKITQSPIYMIGDFKNECNEFD